MQSINSWIEQTFETSYISLTYCLQIPCFFDVCYKTNEEVNQTLRDLTELKEGIPVEQKEFCSFVIVEQCVDELLVEHAYIHDGFLINRPIKKVW